MELFEPALKKHFPFFVTALQKSSSGFLVDPSVTWIDLIVAEYVANMEEKTPELLDSFPEMRHHKEKIHAIPQIQQWRNYRPVTRM